MIAEPTCPACGARDVRPILAFNGLPVFCNVLADSPARARGAPTGDVHLVQCQSCGTLVNAAFDAEAADYRPGYENSLHHSEVFQRWARSLAQRLVESHDLAGGTALELGCGGGGFLSLLCDAGMAKAVGYDPSFSGADGAEADDRVEIHGGLLDQDEQMRAELALCRHVLEHVPEPAPIVELLGRVAADDGVVYLEVPDATTMLRDGGVYDVIYEHCSYFAAPGLRALVERSGLEVLDVRAEFGGQYLSLEAAPGRTVPGELDPGDVAELVESGRQFGAHATSTLDRWGEELDRLRDAGRDAVVWGAGSKGVTFVNLVAGGDTISRLVDLNPLKRGRFVPVSAQPVVSPGDLADEPPDLVIVMNPLYRDEVGAALVELGLSAEVVLA